MTPPSLADVRRMGQDHPHLEADPTYSRLVMRRLSPWVTWVVVRTTPLSADAVTGLAIVCGVTAAGLVLVPTAVSYLAALVLLQLAYLFDTVDGEVARVRGTSGKRGTYLDLVGHFIQNRALYGAAGYVLMVVTGFAPWAVFLAMLGVAFASPVGEQSRMHVIGLRPSAAEATHGRMAVSPLPPGASAAARAYWMYRRIAFLWNYPASMNLFCLALLADAARLIGGAAEPLALPLLAGGFAGSLAVKQLANAARIFRSEHWPE